MHLPEKLQDAIAEEAEKFNWHDILNAREELTDRYTNMQTRSKAFMGTDAERCAYVIARMPATYAVIHRILRELQQRASNISITIESLLDLGSGPGTTLWAAADILPDLTKATQIEKDCALITLGKRLSAVADWPAKLVVDWKSQNMEQVQVAGTYDLVVLSYSVGELLSTSIPAMIEAAWKLTNKYLIVIEAGTPVGFGRIRAIRSQLIELGGGIVAPCPHSMACPMPEGDWCHFSERIERTSMHRRLKKGALGHEDEKYSYIIGSKVQTSQTESRILRIPMKRSGHVILSLCGKDGLVQKTVSKRNSEEYKSARKSEWGDEFIDGV